MIRGVDVSLYQPRVDWRQLRADGFEFFYARCCEGTVPDELHGTHLANGRAAGLVGGSYQFGHPSMDVEACAEFFLARASLIHGQLRPVLDMESLSTGDDGKKRVPENAGEWTDQWCEIVKTALMRLFPDSFGARRGPIVYASKSYWEAMCILRPSVGGPLGWDWWNAEYVNGTPCQPKTPLPYVAHQYAGNVALAGQVGLWDLDAVYEDSLERLLL